VMKGEKIGTLEVGKLADMIIIDRDYLTVAEQDILKIRPLMTMLGGEIGVLQQSLAQEFGMDPMGRPYLFTDDEITHIGGPLGN